MIKKILFFSAFFTALILAQEYTNSEDEIYPFLERMENLHIIDNYNSFELPKTKNEIAEYLSQIENKKNELNSIDLALLGHFKIEYSYELYKNTETFTGIINGNYDFLSHQNKYLYYKADTSGNKILINLLAQGQLVHFKENESSISKLGYIGGIIHGVILDKIGFSVQGINGIVFGDKKAALSLDELKYNFKLNETSEESFFDETEGYLSADFDFLKLKIGRDRQQIGYGVVKSILSSEIPAIDYLSFRIDYNFFSYSFFHGKLLGAPSSVIDPIFGDYNYIPEKYMVYHRVGFNLSKHADFGLGEIAIYGDRGIDIAYLNPFNFYKTIEHSNRDRDNSILFVDFNNNSIKGLKLFSNILIDDISFGKIGTGWWGNKTLMNFGLSTNVFYSLLPINLNIEYTKIEPYTFTHRLSRNVYTNFNYNLLGDELKPNSSNIFFGLNLLAAHNVNINFSYFYSIHGANEFDENGNVIRNVGGDIFLSKRIGDSDNIKFLEGEREYSSIYNFGIEYEFYRQIFLQLDAHYVHKNFNSSQSQEEFQTLLTLSFIL
ncbi:MAG TPA: hypothetical protein VFF33_02700 [Ignavibacteriaceae bacterium]|nr:hypothetical protein [Ignavibacteriaceae bacterium]